MTKKQTERTIAICKFIEARRIKYSWEKTYPVYNLRNTGCSHRYGVFCVRDMRFHAEYDWIIPVLDKIRNIKLNNGEYPIVQILWKVSVIISIEPDSNFIIVKWSKNKPMITVIFIAVSLFSEWYNQNN